MKSVKQILEEKKFGNARYNRHEFQAFGNLLSEELNDPNHRSLYIRLAKTIDRKILEQARSFVKEAGKLKTGSKARLFMWKMKELRDKLKAVETTKEK